MGNHEPISLTEFPERTFYAARQSSETSYVTLNDIKTASRLTYHLDMLDIQLNVGTI